MSPYRDLREFIQQVESFGWLRRVDGADPCKEIGGITEVAAGRPDCPAVLFDRVIGFRPGFRVFTNATTSVQRAALALGIDPALSPGEALKAWREKRRHLDPLPPFEVNDAAFLQNSMRGGEVDLSKIPSPQWHGADGGPYIGTAAIVVLRDPDGGWINVAVYRVQVHARDRVSIQFDHPGRHGAIIAKKYWDQNRPCPVAVVGGEDPALFVSGFEYLPAGYSEYDFAGAIKGAPIAVHSGPETGLPIPADAEIVLEGELLPPGQETLLEGPFGEFTGYYASEARPCPAVRVTALHHRDDPILLGSPPMKPPHAHFGLPLRAATIWDHLESVGVTDVVGVWQHVSQLITVVALTQRYDGHAKRAALVAAADSYMARFIVVVDDDVDVSDINDVMWAVATRCEPGEQTDVIRNAWSSALDPRIPPADKQRDVTSHTKMIVDACRPFSWRSSFPATSSLSAEEAHAIAAKWSEELDPPEGPGRPSSA